MLTDEMLAAPVAYDTNTKMNPPLREAADRDAMLQGIADGSVDVIATDHAPHHYDEKKVEFDSAPFGIIGLETAVSLCFDRLVHAGRHHAAAAGRAAVGEPGADPAACPAARCRKARRPTSRILAPDLPVTVDAATMRSQVEEHAVRRLAAARRRRGDDRRRANGVRRTRATRRRTCERGELQPPAIWTEDSSDGQTRGDSRARRWRTCSSSKC